MEKRTTPVFDNTILGGTLRGGLRSSAALFAGALLLAAFGGEARGQGLDLPQKFLVYEDTHGLALDQSLEILLENHCRTPVSVDIQTIDINGLSGNDNTTVDLEGRPRGFGFVEMPSSSSEPRRRIAVRATVVSPIPPGACPPGLLPIAVAAATVNPDGSTALLEDPLVGFHFSLDVQGPSNESPVLVRLGPLQVAEVLAVNTCSVPASLRVGIRDLLTGIDQEDLEIRLPGFGT